MRAVVVGVPDTSEPIAALLRAVHEARVRRLPLTVVHGSAAPFGNPPTEESENALRDRLRGAVLACSVGQLDVDVVLSGAEAVPALLLAAEGAALLVVGGRSRASTGRHVLGTVSGGCLQAAQCPVMVVPFAAPETDGPGRVIVAVDEGGPSHAALSWAAAQAFASHAVLDAVAVCPPGRDPEAVRASVSQALRGAGSDGVLGQELHVLEGSPVDAIVARLTADDLLVVGSRGHSSLLGLLLSSTSASLVARATCPTVVVRAGQARRELHVRREGDVGPARRGRSPLTEDSRS